jgi:hypothetical protein
MHDEKPASDTSPATPVATQASYSVPDLPLRWAPSVTRFASTWSYVHVRDGSQHQSRNSRLKERQGNKLMLPQHNVQQDNNIIGISDGHLIIIGTSSSSLEHLHVGKRLLQHCSCRGHSI